MTFTNQPLTNNTAYSTLSSDPETPISRSPNNIRPYMQTILTRIASSPEPENLQPISNVALALPYLFMCGICLVPAITCLILFHIY